MKMRLLVLVAALFVVTAACGESSKVGSDQLLNFQEQANKGRVGDRTTTTAIANSGGGGGGGKVGVGQETTVPKVVTTQTTRQAILEVTINSDLSTATQFDPNSPEAGAKAAKGTVVRFVNRDTEVRSVESANNAFRASGPIQPGASWDYLATNVGEFPYRDGTRPYATGSFEIVNR